MKQLNLLLLLFLFISGNSIAQNRLVIDPQAHNGIVNEMAFTANGKFLISVSDDKTIRIWNVEEGELDRTIRTFAGDGPNGAIYAMALSPDDRFLAVGGYFEENEIRLIDLEKETEVVLLKGHKNVITSLEFSSDGLKLASADATGSVIVWAVNFAKGKIVASLTKDLKGYSQPVYGLSFSPNSKQLVSASNDGSLKLWNLEGASEPTNMLMHMDKVRSCSFSSDGKWIISGGNKGKLILWDSRGAFNKYLGSIDESVRDIKTLGDDVLVSGSNGYRFSLKASMNTGQLKVPFSKVSASAISNNKLVAFAGGSQGAIIIYDLATNDSIQVLGNRTQQISKIGISTNGIIAFANKNGEVENGFNLSSLSFIWDIKDANTFATEKHDDGAYKLVRFDKYTLSTGFSGTVKMDQRVDGRLRAYSIIDDKTIAVGGDYSLKLYTRNGVLIGALKGFNGAITSITSYNNRILALCDDQTVRVWNQSTLELLASVYIAPKNDWICWTPQGYYNASSGGEKYMGWQVDEKASELSKFYKSSVFASKFYNPELVKQTVAMGSFSMAFEKVKPVEKAISVTDVAKVKAEKSKVIKSAPAIEWVLPELLNTTQNQSKITIKAIIRSESKIKMVKILINGRPSKNSRNVVVPKLIGEFDIEVEQELILNNDVNEIRIFVANQEAKMVSEKRVINLEGALAKGNGRSLKVINYSDRPDLYILSIGISEYANADYNLNYADNDAESITEVFTELGTEVYKDVNAVQLLNSEADKPSILAAFKNLSDKVQAKDMVLVFIASHGINVNGAFYILPHEADLIQKPENVVSWNDLTKTLSALPSNVVVMIDACHSGQLGVNLTQYSANNTEALRNASDDENGLVLMAASTGSESALETPEWEHGAFTLAVLEGIKNGKADIRKDGTIYLRELDYYVSERTIELTENAQHPTTQKPSTISRLSIINLNK